MRVLIAEYNYAGHHLAFVGYLLPALLAAGYRVTIAIPDEGFRSADYQAHLMPFADQFECHSLGAMPIGRRFSNTRQRIDSVAAAVKATAPDQILLPSADSITYGHPLGTRRARAILGHDIPCAVCLHSGHAGRGIRRIGQMARDAFEPFAIRLAPWQRINFLNPLVYSDLVSSRPDLISRIGTIPNPNPPNIDLDRFESRRALGIPEEGRYIVIAGSLQLLWKGIERLLDAFSRMNRAKSDRLLLAGRITPPLLALLNNAYAGEVSRGEIVTINQFLSEEEMAWVISSADLVAVPYPRFARVSGILLRALAAGRPVLTDNCGWIGHVTKSFELGWTCDVKNADQFCDALSAALEDSADYTQSDGARLLRQYHLVENFQQHWLRETRILAGLPFEDPQITWDQLEEFTHNR